MIPSAGLMWQPRVCKATAACPAWLTRSTASWMFTLPCAVASRIQPCATPWRRAARAAACCTSGSAPSSAPRRGCCLGHQRLPVQWPRFHTGQRVGTLPAGGAGSAGVLPVGGSGISSRSESVPASPCGGSPSPSLSPSALVTYCGASSVGDRGRVLRGAAGSPIVVSLCLRAGHGVRISCTWCVGALVRCSLLRWRKGVPGGGAFHHCEGRLVSGAVPPPAVRPLERAARVPRPVCPGCGRCGRGDPAPAPQRAPLLAGVARCGGGGGTSSGWCLPPL